MICGISRRRRNEKLCNDRSCIVGSAGFAGYRRYNLEDAMTSISILYGDFIIGVLAFIGGWYIGPKITAVITTFIAMLRSKV